MDLNLFVKDAMGLKLNASEYKDGLFFLPTDFLNETEKLGALELLRGYIEYNQLNGTAKYNKLADNIIIEINY